MNGWTFCASEIDSLSYDYACANVKRNNFQEKIEGLIALNILDLLIFILATFGEYFSVVRLVQSNVVLEELLSRDEKIYHFSMCNPPFFSSSSEVYKNKSRSINRPKPSSICTGSESEILTSGGEVEFVAKMITDSLRLRTRIKYI